MLLAVCCVCALACADTLSDTIPHVFSAGDTARASQVNENFYYLLQRIRRAEAAADSLALVALSLRDSLDAASSNAKSYADSVARAKAFSALPIGTIIGSLLSPDKFAARFGADSVYWKLADSSTASAEYFTATGKSNLPDLRGVFLRGINAGRDTTAGDAAGERTAGSYQADEFKKHTHLENLAAGNGGIHSGGSYGVINKIQTGPAGGAETRPRNVAVYWYVKVK
jgi:hypothetical protein